MLLGNRSGVWSGKEKEIPNYVKIESYDGNPISFSIQNGASLDIQSCTIVKGKPSERWYDVPKGNFQTQFDSPIALKARVHIYDALGSPTLRFRFTISAGSTRTRNIKVSGNLNYLNDPEGNIVSGTLPSYMYAYLFYGSDVVDASELIIDDSVQLNSYCYQEMFGQCNSLVNPPTLSNVNMVSYNQYCFDHMFEGCSSLTTAPELPATTLCGYCYNYMFSNCTSLTTPPELQATTLAAHCYERMFSGCTSLTQAPELPATTSTNYCYLSMFAGCTSLTTAPELPATNLAEGCYKSMFFGTGLIMTPELPATQLQNECYSKMFQSCYSLTTAQELPATTLKYECYAEMFSYCTSLTTPPTLPSTTLYDYCYRGMFMSCTSLVNAPLLPAEQEKPYCYQQMFQYCSNLNNITVGLKSFDSSNNTAFWLESTQYNGTFHCPVELGTNETIQRGDSYCPSNWTVVNDV